MPMHPHAFAHPFNPRSCRPQPCKPCPVSFYLIMPRVKGRPGWTTPSEITTNLTKPDHATLLKELSFRHLTQCLCVPRNPLLFKEFHTSFSRLCISSW